MNISKPLSDSSLTLTRAEIKGLLKAIDPTGDDLIINYDASGIGYPSKAWYNRTLNEALDSIMEYCETDTEVLGEIRNAGADEQLLLTTIREQYGYDGYIVTDKYEGASIFVSFESNQFKNIDNKNPTSNQDIRFNLKSNPKASLSNGEIRKLAANYTRDKVYSRKETQIAINDILADISGLFTDEKVSIKGKTKEQAIQMLWQGLNTVQGKLDCRFTQKNRIGTRPILLFFWWNWRESNSRPKII